MGGMNKTQIEDKVMNLLSPVAKDHGFELVDVEWTTDSGRKTLRAFVDKEGGISIDDCAFLSGYLEDVLDIEDAVPGAYLFEVSSPGLNRPLRRKEHFEKAIGEEIQLATKEKVNGRKNYKGILKGCESELIKIEIDGQDHEVPLAEVQKARIVFDFENSKRRP